MIVEMIIIFNRARRLKINNLNVVYDNIADYVKRCKKCGDDNN